MNNSKPFWAKPIITPSSPLTKTLHPKNQVTIVIKLFFVIDALAKLAAG
jgi:hypothetical protein